MNVFFFFFFFKQKTAYDMRISDWSSDVCSSDLLRSVERGTRAAAQRDRPPALRPDRDRQFGFGRRRLYRLRDRADRKSVVSGKSVSVRVDLGGRRIIKKKNQSKTFKNTNIFRSY